MSDKRLGGMKLGNFSGIKKPQPEPTKPAEPEVDSALPSEDKPEVVAEDKTEPETKTQSRAKKTNPKSAKTTKSKAKVGKKNQAKELVTVNIKIRKDQKAWLADTASTVRDNNTEPVAPSERVYPQHLIGVAIDLLQNVDVDWSEVKNVEELKEHLNL